MRLYDEIIHKRGVYQTTIEHFKDESCSIENIISNQVKELELYMAITK